MTAPGGPHLSRTATIDLIVSESATYDDAFARIRQLQRDRGLRPDDHLIGRELEARMGGDLVELDDEGRPTNPLRRRWRL